MDIPLRRVVLFLAGVLWGYMVAMHVMMWVAWWLVRKRD